MYPLLQLLRVSIFYFVSPTLTEVRGLENNLISHSKVRHKAPAANAFSVNFELEKRIWWWRFWLLLRHVSGAWRKEIWANSLNKPLASGMIDDMFVLLLLLLLKLTPVSTMFDSRRRCSDGSSDRIRSQIVLGRLRLRYMFSGAWYSSWLRRTSITRASPFLALQQRNIHWYTVSRKK